MARSFDDSHQAYSSTLAAYTLKQFSAARAALDSHKDAAAKLPAINSYDYRNLKPSSDISPQPASPESPPTHHHDDNEIDEGKVH